MRERRVKNGREVLFDYKELFLSKTKQKGLKLVEMRRGPMSYETSTGTKFWKDHPFQWIPEDEADFLLSIKSPVVEFSAATIEDVEDYYAD